MSRRKKQAIQKELLDQLLTGGSARAPYEQGGLGDLLRNTLKERVVF